MDLHYLFNPASVAIIGATPEEGKLGNVILKNLRKNYKGDIFLINPKYNMIGSYRCYPDISHIEKDIDLAVIALPARFANELFVECQKKNVKFVIIIAGGFGEIGVEGKKLEDSLKNAVPNGNAHIIGPNTVGVYLPESGVSTALTVEERSEFPGFGDIAYISQSGALGLLTLDQLAFYNIKIHSFINIGNRIDINEVDLIEYLSSIPNVNAIMLYLESFNNARRFFDMARKIAANKPVVLLKGGRTPDGQKAALHHTGAMMQNGDVLDGLFKQCGITKANDETELIDYALALAYLRPLYGKNIAIITSAGGVGVVSSDLFYSTKSSLKLAMLSEKTTDALKKVISSIGSVANPVDMTVEATNKEYDDVLGILNGAGEVDGVILYALFQSPHVDHELLPVLKKWLGKKTLIVGTIGGKYTAEMIKKMNGENIPVYPSIKRAVEVADMLYQRGAYLSRGV